MKTRNAIVVFAMIAGLALSAPGLAAGRGGQGKGRTVQQETRSENQTRTQQRLRDGSCCGTGTQQGTRSRGGKTYGPGDGTGNQGEGPKDGTGYGATTKP